MSKELITENELFAKLRENIMTALKTFGITGFSVQRFAQANITNSDGLVLLNHIRTKREGWEWKKFECISKDAELYAEYGWIESVIYQIHIIKKMTNGDTETTITGEDVANRLIAWFNGPGIDKLKDENISNLLIDQDDIMIYNDDSDQYQRRVVFSLNLIVNKKFSQAEPSLNICGVKTKPI